MKEHAKVQTTVKFQHEEGFVGGDLPSNFIVSFYPPQPLPSQPSP